jgi:hypothetical protein
MVAIIDECYMYVSYGVRHSAHAGQFCTVNRSSQLPGGMPSA